MNKGITITIIDKRNKDKDGNQYEVIIGACHRMSTHPNPEVNAVGKYLDSLAMKYRDQN